MLILKTRDIWDWKKILIRSILGLTSVSILIGLSLWGYVQYKDRPRVQNSLWDINLGASENDLLFKKGKPTNKITNTLWIYDDKGIYSKDKYYFFTFKEGKVNRISLIGSGNLEGIQGIYIGSSLNSILEKFGEPSDIIFSEDGLSREYRFKKYNLSFGVKKNRVKRISVIDYNKKHKTSKTNRSNTKQLEQLIKKNGLSSILRR
jgi:hypothetical protein